MDPNIDRYNGFNLPQPIGETGNPVPEASAPSMHPNTPEAPASRERVPVANMSIPGPTANPVATSDAQVQSPAGSDGADPGAVTIDTPAVANDSDRIEKEWVDKAKHIAETTRQDPYQQNRQLTNVKADYIQKRYGKTLKLSK